MKIDRSVSALVQKHSDHFKWITPKNIVIARWVRFKCQFGCDTYGRCATCPPHVPTLEECREFFDDYSRAVLLHLPRLVRSVPEKNSWAKRTNAALIQLEREVFLLGYHKAFILPMDECRLCDSCGQTRAGCRNKKMARPSPESLGVDVFATARNAGFEIAVLTDHRSTMNRYSLLLVD